MLPRPLLTIAIPTYNRATYLRLTLAQLQSELVTCELGSIEILVSDNASSDDTAQVVEEFQSVGFAIRYLLNQSNIGSDANIAECFGAAKGSYVVILGDDDLFCDGSLQWLMAVLKTRQHGVVCMRAYGFDNDFMEEHPGDFGSDKTYSNAGEFVVAIGPLVTLISACVINKDCLSDVDARVYCGTNLVQVHLVLLAALRKKTNLYSERYRLACKRNNSGGYDYVQVFVEQLGEILDAYEVCGLSRKSIVAFENRMLLGHMPFYLWRQRVSRSGDQSKNRSRLRARYKKNLVALWILLMPIVVLPRLIAIVWGGAVTLFGRIYYGEFRRGIYFLFNKIRSCFVRV
ncbi:MAG: glycosyltransferase family 2 protein [Gammaproteobacteria bacterium]